MVKVIVQIFLTLFMLLAVFVVKDITVTRITLLAVVAFTFLPDKVWNKFK